jgi:hypothetical protein
MATSGELNREFGVYRSKCCGDEIAISQGATFPDCPRHDATEWKSVSQVELIHELEREEPAA